MGKAEIVCVIPARYASSRLPGKPLLLINGLPLVMWAYNLAVESCAFKSVYVATDDRRVFDEVVRHKGLAVMTSAEHDSGTDRVFEAIRDIECGYVVNLQGDEPQIPVSVIRDFAEELVKIDDNSLITIVSNATIDDMKSDSAVKAVLAANGDALYFSRSLIPCNVRSEEKKGLLHRGIYGFTKRSLEKFCELPKGNIEKIEKLEQLRALEWGMRIHCIIRDFKSRGIDTKDDLEEFRRIVTTR